MPEWRPDVLRRLSDLHLSPTREAEIVDELSQHLDDHYRELVAGGATPDEAERLALAEFRAGNLLAQHIAALRLAHQPPPITPAAPSRRMFAGLWQDIRYAARSLRRQPAFAAVTMLTLALGIGANSAIFALVDATLLRPLPFPDAGQLVAVSERTPTTSDARVSPANMNDWVARSQSFVAIGATAPNVASMVLANADGSTETIPRQWASHAIFDALGAKAVAGRTFQRSDDFEELGKVVLAESFWRSRFNADPAVIGTSLRLDGDPYEVLGVVPDEAQILGRTSMWALRPVETETSTGARRSYYLRAIGRLKPGVTLDEARADIDRVAADLAREFPQTNTGRGVNLVPLRDQIIGGDLRQTSTLFLAVVGVVLFICCANVASLLLTRTLARRRELALRAALGADRRRLTALVLTESVMLAIGGGAIGLAIAALVLRAAPALIPDGLLPPAVMPELDLRVIVFCAVTALVSGVLFGLVPAWHGTAPSPSQLTNTRVTGGGRTRQWLVAGQIATAVTVLVGAGLLVRTLVAVGRVDRGYRADRVLTMMVDPPGSPRLGAFYQEVEGNIRALPGVRDVAWATTLPLGESYLGEVSAEVAGENMAPGDRPTADFQIVSPTYFSALDLPIVAGRGFDGRDTVDGQRVCMVNEAFARRHLSPQSPIGARLTLRSLSSTTDAGSACEVIGVVKQVKGRPDETDDLMQVYVPLVQNMVGDIFLFVRAASGDANALGVAVRAAIARADTTQQTSVRDLQTLDDVMLDATSRHRFRAALVTAFASLALVLAMVGVFGVLLYSVQQRVREIGVRRALGASAADVLRLVAGSGGRVIAAGVLAGLVLAALGGRLISAMLFGVEPLDPVTYAAVASLVAVTAVLSMAGPVWRALRVDPAIALRVE